MKKIVYRTVQNEPMKIISAAPSLKAENYPDASTVKSRIVYATTNPGKFDEVRHIFRGYNLDIHSPSEFGVSLDVEETGKNLEENAILKAESYLPLLPKDVIVISDDTGIEIDALGGEPGIKVRRWKGYRMEDDEILSYCLERLQGIPEIDRGAQFRTIIAVAKHDSPTQLFEGILRGKILTKPHNLRVVGLPFQPLFFATEYQKMLYAIHDLSFEQKIKEGILTHRERAVVAAIPYLSTLLD